MTKQDVETARARAEALLRKFLNSDQVRDLDANGWFDVRVEDRTYRLERGRVGNVRLMAAGEAVARFCIHPRMDVPDSDTLLSQKLLLESDEAKFLEIANRSELLGLMTEERRPPRQPREEVRPLPQQAREDLIARCLVSAEGRSHLAVAVWYAAKNAGALRGAVSESSAASSRSRTEVAMRLAEASRPGESRYVRAIRKWVALHRSTEVANAA